MVAAHSMRKSVQSFSSICRSLLLLLILLLCFVKDSQGFPDFKIDNIADKLKGEHSLEKRAVLWNFCSQKLVQITKPGSRGVNARGSRNSEFSNLTIISIDGGFIRIRGMANKLYLCFNKKGKLQTRFQPPKSLPHSCDFSQNLTGDGYHTFKLRDKPEWSIGFKKRGKKLPGFIRKPSQEPCHHFSLDLLNPTPITIPFDFNKKKNYLFNNSGKFRIRHKKRKKNRRREKERLRKSQKTRNGVKR